MLWTIFKAHRKLLSLVKKGQLKEALDLLEKLPVNQKDVLMLQSRLSELGKEEIRGTSDSNERRIIKNQIVAATIEIINDFSPVNNIDLILKKFLNEVLIWAARVLGGSAVLFFIWFLWEISNSTCRLPSYYNPPSKKDAIDSSNYEVRRDNQLLEVRKFSGRDSLGRKADFIIYIVREFDWDKNEVTETKKDGVRADVCEHLKSSNLTSQINDDNLLAIICFGNASEEEDPNLPDYTSRLSKEEDRAFKRAKKLADCIILQKTQPIVYLLNLGKYEEVEFDSGETAYQRQVIIIGIKRLDNFVLTDQALRNGLLYEHYAGNLRMNIELFSRVQPESYGLPIVHYRN